MPTCPLPPEGAGFFSFIPAPFVLTRLLLVWDIKPAGDERLQLFQDLSGLRTGRGHDKLGAADGLKRHQRHDGLAADDVSILFDLHVGVEPRGDLREKSCRPHVETVLVQQHQFFLERHFGH